MPAPLYLPADDRERQRVREKATRIRAQRFPSQETRDLVSFLKRAGTQAYRTVTNPEATGRSIGEGIKGAETQIARFAAQRLPGPQADTYKGYRGTAYPNAPPPPSNKVSRFLERTEQPRTQAEAVGRGVAGTVFGEPQSFESLGPLGGLFAMPGLNMGAEAFRIPGGVSSAAAQVKGLPRAAETAAVERLGTKPFLPSTRAVVARRPAGGMVGGEAAKDIRSVDAEIKKLTEVHRIAMKAGAPTREIEQAIADMQGTRRSMLESALSPEDLARMDELSQRLIPEAAANLEGVKATGEGFQKAPPFGSLERADWVNARRLRSEQGGRNLNKAARVKEATLKLRVLQDEYRSITGLEPENVPVEMAPRTAGQAPLGIPGVAAKGEMFPEFQGKGVSAQQMAAEEQARLLELQRNRPLPGQTEMFPPRAAAGVTPKVPTPPPSRAGSEGAAALPAQPRTPAAAPKVTHVGQTPILEALGRNLRLFSENSAEARRYISEQINPLLRARYGENYPLVTPRIDFPGGNLGLEVAGDNAQRFIKDFGLVERPGRSGAGFYDETRRQWRTGVYDMPSVADASLKLPEPASTASERVLPTETPPTPEAPAPPAPPSLPPAGGLPPSPPAGTTLPPPEEPFAANIRLAKYPEDLRETIKTWADTNPQAVQEARRGTRTDAQVLQDAKDLTEEMGGDFAKLQRRWKPGQAWNAEEVTAIRGVLREKTGAVVQAAKDARANDSSVAQTRLVLALEEQARVQEIVHGVTAEAGRSLRAFRQEAFDAISANDNRRMEELLRRLGGKGKTQEVAQALTSLDLENPYAVNNFIRNAMKPSMWDKIWFIFYNSILLGPKTHIINGLSNIVTMGISPAERAYSAGVEQGLARLQGRQVERFFAEVPADAFGALHGMHSGFEAAASTLRYGISPTQASKWEYRTNPFKGTVGRIIGAPTTALEAADAFNREANYAAALGAEIVRAAKKEGLKGTAYLERIAELKSSPTLAMMQEANRVAEYRLFRQPLGTWASKIMEMKDTITPLRLVIPFIRTPVNLLKYGIERSPLGIADPKLWRAIAQKSPEASDQIGRILLGSTLAAAVAWRFGTGEITGAAPKDAAERDRFYREGKQPFAVRIGNRWVQWQRIEPLNQTLAQLVAVVEAVQAKDKSIEQKVAQAAMTITQNLVSQNYVSTLSGLLDAISQPERYGDSFIQRLALSFVPASAGLRTAAQLTDTTIRKPKTIAEAVRAGIPGLSSSVPPALTAFGQEAQRQSPAWSPINVSKAQQTAVDAELERLGTEVGFVGTSIGGQKLTREEQQHYQVLAGQKSYELLEALIASDSYETASDAMKAKAVDRRVEQAREYARNLILTSRASGLTPEQRGSIRAIKTPVSVLTEEQRAKIRALKAQRTPVGATP